MGQSDQAANDHGRSAKSATSFEALPGTHARKLPDRNRLDLHETYRKSGDVAGRRAALDDLLRHEPRNLDGLLLMGELLREVGDDRAAYAFFMAAVRQASEAPPPARLHAFLDHAQSFLRWSQAGFEKHLLGTVRPAAAGASGISRFERALDMLLGRRSLFLSEPSMLYFPGSTQQPFYDRSFFPWAEAVEKAADDIRRELLSLKDDFAPYVLGNPDRPRPAANPLLDDPAWGAFHVLRAGEATPGAVGLSATMNALRQAPMPYIPKLAPNVLFSRLQPGAHIRPHHGLLNTRLICHLPLVVSERCGIRVGDETREWREGEMLIFDDSIEHEAWNRGTGVRTVLLFEIWRPDIVGDEQEQVAGLLETIARYDGEIPLAS